MYGRHGSEPLLHPCHTWQYAQGQAESERCRCRPRPSSRMVVLNVISPPRADRRAKSHTGATLPAHLAARLAAVGLRCGHVRAVPRRPSTIGSCQHRISRSLAPESGQKASRHTTDWRWPTGRSSPCPRSPWKGMPTGAAPGRPCVCQAILGSYAHRVITGGIGQSASGDSRVPSAEAVVDVDGY
jgi:hypothetical protein